MRRVGLLGIATLLLLTGCDGEPLVREGPTPFPVSEACRAAFAAAVGESGGDLGLEELPGVARGSLAHLDATLEACETSQEWFEAYRGHLHEATEGVSASSALRSLCQRVEGPACENVALGPRRGEPHP